MNFESLLTRLKGFREAFSTAQLLSMAGAFVVVVGVIVGAAWWLNEPTYRVLFSELDPESAGRVSERLRSQEVPFQLADGGRTILVPQERIDQLRIDFATSGLPQQGRMGWEIFDQTQFGATDFLEQVNFRRALEGEIGRTIATISEVAAARVHITPGKSSIFGATEQPAKASVMLKLRSSRLPAASTIQGIAALVAASVEGLQAESVVVVDQTGRPLSTPNQGSDEPLSGAHVERQRSYEMALAKQVVDMMESVVGPGAVRATVSARLYQSNEERLEESFGAPTIRSEELKEQGSSGAALTQGIAGTRANVPGVVPPGATEPTPTTLAAATPAPGGIINPISRSEVRNYEIPKTTVKSSRPRGGVERLSVAVLIDDEHYSEKGADGAMVPKTRPRTKEQLQKLTEIVMTGTGVDTTRGDQITVHNVAFSYPPVEEPETPGFLTRFGPQIALGLKLLVVLLLGTAAFFFVGRSLMPRKVVDATPVDEPMLPRQLPKTIEEIEGEIAAQLDSAAIQLDRRLPVLTKKLTGLAQKDPETAARLVRTWLLEDNKK